MIDERFQKILNGLDGIMPPINEREEGEERKKEQERYRLLASVGCSHAYSKLYVLSINKKLTQFNTKTFKKEEASWGHGYDQTSNWETIIFGGNHYAINEDRLISSFGLNEIKNIIDTLENGNIILNFHEDSYRAPLENIVKHWRLLFNLPVYPCIKVTSSMFDVDFNNPTKLELVTLGEEENEEAPPQNLDSKLLEIKEDILREMREAIATIPVTKTSPKPAKPTPSEGGGNDYEDVLTERERKMIDLAEDGHSQSEIAEKLDTSIQNVHNTLKRAKNKLVN